MRALSPRIWPDRCSKIERCSVLGTNFYKILKARYLLKRRTNRLDFSDAALAFQVSLKIFRVIVKGIL